MSFSIKRADREPAIECALTVGGSPVDLSGTIVRFIMREEGTSVAKVNAVATVTGSGTVMYAWGATDTDKAGLFRAEWEVTFAGGLKRTFPSDGYLYVNVVADLG